MAMAAADPAPAEVITWARGSATFPAAQTPGTLVNPVPSTSGKPASSHSQPCTPQLAERRAEVLTGATVTQISHANLERTVSCGQGHRSQRDASHPGAPARLAGGADVTCW